MKDGPTSAPPPAATHEPLRYNPCIDDPFVPLCRTDDPLAAHATAAWSAFATQLFIGSARRQIFKTSWR